MALETQDSTGQVIQPRKVTHWGDGATALTNRDVSLDLKALVDDSIKGLMRTLGDAGAAPLNAAGKTLLYFAGQSELGQSYIRSALYVNDRALDTTTPLPNAGVYTSGSFNAYQSSVGFITVMLKTDRNGLLDIEQSWDDVNWDLAEQTAIVAGTTLAVRKQLYAKYVRYRITNNSGVDQTYLRAGHGFNLA